MTISQDYAHDHDHDSLQDDDEHEEHCPHSHTHSHHHHCHHDDEDDDLDSIDDVSPIALRHSNLNRATPRSPRAQRHGRYNSFGGKSSSGLDGYEAFENTNNKKKRKIPTSGIQQGALNAEFAHMGLSSRDASVEGLSASPSGMGVGGAGRGRTGGRKSNTRNPLAPSTNGTNVRAGSAKYEQSPVTPNGEYSDSDLSRSRTDSSSGDGKNDQGIISKAIANATTLLRGKGQDNGNVLDSHKRTPTNSQFTFTCESDAKGVKFPEQSLYSPDYAHRVNSAPAAAPSQTPNYERAEYAGRNPPQPNQPTQQPQKQRRRRKGDVYTLQARQRKAQQEMNNMQHPPSHEDMWICEFCEYESIFGSPPQALMRQYEIKDRKEKKRLAEKRRLLEKAKLKGRKGKKQTKAAKAANNAAQQPINNQNYDQQPLEDDYLDEGYDDDPEPIPAPPPPQAPVKQTMPGAYDRGGGISRSVSDPAAMGAAAGGGSIR